MRLKATILTIAFLFFASTGLVMAERQNFQGAVYTMTNSAKGNEVLVFSYSLNGGNNTISAFRVANNGRLFPIDIDAADVPAGANGLAAR